LARGAEIGRFNMGSTVILLLPPDTVAWREGLAANRGVRLGERLGWLDAAR
jgi:phosphatidylserine decarboxylase